MTDPQAIRAQVRQYIVENFLYMRPDVELTDDSLMGRGIVTEQHLGSVSAIARHVVARRAQPAAYAA